MDKSNFQLSKQCILSTDFKLNDKIKFPENLNISLEGKTSVQMIDENSANVIFKLSVFKDIEFEKVPFQMEVISKGLFTWDDSIDKNNLETYLNVNAPSILVSYIRSVISMITSYAGISNFMIPLINFYKNPEHEKKE